MSSSASSIRIVAPGSSSPPGIGKYRYIALLAEGGMAGVFLAVTKTAEFEKLLVIKQLYASLAEDPSFVAMFTDEARLAARLNHPNVVQTYEVGSAGDVHFIAMEFLEGVPYARLARNRDRIEPPLAIHLRAIIETLRGLHYAHDLTDFDGKPLNVVHRDISPQNVMLTFGGGVKVLDFGIAKAALAVDRRPEDFKGKLKYMAPEQALLEDVDRRADIFSVGVMLWEAVARRRFYDKGEDKMARLVAGAHPSLPSVRHDVPRRLVEICEKALARDRNARYPTADAMADDLEEWLEGTSQFVSARDVGVFVAEKFARTRTKIADAVDAQLKLFRSLPEESPATLPLSRIPVDVAVEEGDIEEPPMLSAAPTDPDIQTVGTLAMAPIVAPVAMAFPAPEMGRSAHRIAIATPVKVAPLAPPTLAAWIEPASFSSVPPPRRRSATGFVGACLAMLLLLVVASGFSFLRGRATGAAMARTAAPVMTPPGVAPPVFESNKDIEITIKASPPEATIAVDGEPVANPLSRKRAPDALSHSIHVEAKGYDPRDEHVAFDRSIFLALELKKSTIAGRPVKGGSTR